MKRVCQVGILSGIAGVPFTNGYSLILTFASLMKGRKYNSCLQTKEEALDEKLYYKKREINQEFNFLKGKEIQLDKKFKSIEDKVEGGNIFIKNV
jgi:hypothetical protein